jgi:hypothetical protein
VTTLGRGVFETAKCRNCGKTFRKRNSQHAVCSDVCRRQEKREQIIPFDSNANRAFLGEAAELLVCSDLVRRGVSVFRNVATTGPADLVAWNPRNGHMATIDVKGLSTKTRRADGSYHYSYEARHDQDEAGVWIVVVRGDEVVYPDNLSKILFGQN